MKIDRRDFVAGTGAVAAAAGLSGLTTRALAAAETLAAGEAATLGIKYAFSISVFFNERIFIDSPRTRGFVPARGGEVWGPRLQGRVVPYGGADYASHGFHAHYMLEAADGALIYIHNRGYVKRLDGRSLVMARADQRNPDDIIDQQVRTAVDPDAPARFRITPIFDAPAGGPHEWLTRTLFVGHGRRYVSPDHTIFTYYEVL